MPFQLTPAMEVQRDEKGRIRHLNHLTHPFFGDEISKNDPRALAAAYLNEVVEIYGISPQLFRTLGKTPASEPDDAGTELRFGEEKHMMETSTVSFGQTQFGIPIWEAGFTVVMQSAPLRVTSSHSTLHDVEQMPRPTLRGRLVPHRVTAPLLAETMKLPARDAKSLRLTSSQWRVYFYTEDGRFHAETRGHDRAQSGKSIPPPVLPVAPVPAAIAPNRHYLVVEALFSLALPVWGQLNWRVFIEAETGAVLYLRALTACVDGLVYIVDPQTQSNSTTIVASATDAVLDPYRQTALLAGLTAPAAGANQALAGNFVQVLDVALPTAAPPTRPVGSDFNYSSRSDHFAAVNAYFHVDRLFRLMQGMGFTINGATGYFDGTTFPVTVEHRGMSGAINAQCTGNAAGNGIGRLEFGPCIGGTTVGMCTEFQTVAHEFGHALLHDSVHAPNFGFCHSAGDALAVILNDPKTQPTGTSRFQTFPWCPIGGTGERFHNRNIGAGWAWGGSQDDLGYGSEQILSTTLFRVYQVTGGDSIHPHLPSRLATREQAARYMAYLIFRSIGSLATSPITATPNAGVYATALMSADAGTTSFDGYPGGTHRKVIRWSFERQGWYQPAGATTPVTTPGAPPAVDLYIDDGRAGTYSPYLENFWETTDIWNLTAPNPATVPGDHTTPVLAVTNYCYVRVRNRGTSTANNVVVRAYHNRPSTMLVWPGDWQSMTTAELPASGSPAISIPAGGMVTVGPFEWTPTVRGHECLLAWATNSDDRANADTASLMPCASGPTPHWRLVPFDNNIGQRNVAPMPGGGRTVALLAAFADREFFVDNMSEKAVTVRIDLVLPAFLKRLGWRASIARVEGTTIQLKPGEQRRLRLALKAGKDFTEEDVRQAKDEVRIRVRTMVNGIVTGGISYEIDPRLKKPPVEGRGSKEAPRKATLSKTARHNAPGTRVKATSTRRRSAKRR